MNRAKPRVTKVLVERRARALKRHLKAAIDGDGTGVHHARVASRRLREAVPVLATGLKGSKAAKAQRKIRKLTRALGIVRESDVTLTVLDELAARETLPRLALEEVRTHVVENRERHRAAMLKRLERVNRDKLDRRLTSVADALQNAESEDWREPLSAKVLKRGKALTAAIGDAGQLYNSDRLHNVRIAVKKLRYVLEIAAETGVRAAAAPVRALKRMQDSLGRLHDLQVLQTHVAAVQAAPRQNLPDGALNTIARAIEDECRHLHGRYIAAVPQLTGVVEIAKRDVVPQIVRPKARSRALKMTLTARSHGRAKVPAVAVASARRG
jgi:CHAD domain-containing protein